MVTLSNHAHDPLQWLQEFENNRGVQKAALLKAAIDFYCDLSSPLLKKGIEVAVILQSLELDSVTLAAAVLYPGYQSQLISEHAVIELLGEADAKLLHHILQMESLEQLRKLKNPLPHQAEKLRKMLLSMVTDVRVILLILAERLRQLREYKHIPGDQQRQFAQETLEIYAPLANRLGVWQLKWEMEDLCLRYLSPDEYLAIAKGLAARRLTREQFIKHATEVLSVLLKKSGIQGASVTGRVKHIYSIYKKMHRKKVNLEQIYDVAAFRILTHNIKDCYAALSMLHAQWVLIPEEFDDYIASPKPNGYRSIHTVLMGPQNQIMEVQIRTYAMHQESELGMAAHWQYKEGVQQASSYETKIALLRQIMAWQKEMVPSQDQEDKNASSIQDLFADRVYVFTPFGDILDLPQGATPLDFAYHVHSEVGHRCRGAKVNGNMVPLTYKLKTGEVVEVLTAKQDKPSRDWLNPERGYLISLRARAKVQHWFRVKDSEAAAKSNMDEKTGPSHESPAALSFAQPPTPPKKSSSDIQVFGESQLLKHAARCCKPLPGEAIIGYITRQGGISIHKQHCGNVLYLSKQYPARLIEVNWVLANDHAYQANMIIQTQDRAGLLNDITAVLSVEKVNIIGLKTVQDRIPGRADIYMSIEIDHVEKLKKIFELLQNIPHVIKVFRQ